MTVTTRPTGRAVPPRRAWTRPEVAAYSGDTGPWL
jgi:hypothetical protein